MLKRYIWLGVSAREAGVGGYVGDFKKISLRGVGNSQPTPAAVAAGLIKQSPTLRFQFLSWQQVHPQPFISIPFDVMEKRGQGPCSYAHTGRGCCICSNQPNDLFGNLIVPAEMRITYE